MDDVKKLAGLPDNWEPINQPPIRPGQIPLPTVPNPMASYFQGSISPDMQHDATFVGTQYGGPRVPTIALMPIGSSGSPNANSAINSYNRQTGVVTSPVSVINPPPIPPSTGQFFEVNGNGVFSTIYQINGVII